MNRSIYVVRSELGPVKIGIASKPRRRLSQLRTSSAVLLFMEFEAECAGDLHQLEIRAHEILVAHRLEGEWFRTDGAAAIKAVMQAAEELGFALAQSFPGRKKHLQGGKKRGPVPTGWGTPIMCRVRDGQLTDLDAWIEAQPDPKPTRPEAIRRLLEKALAAEN